MSEITPFRFENHDVRIQIDDLGQAWFNANDVCDALEMDNPRQAIKSHVDEGDVQKLDTPTTSGIQFQNHVNESGLYALILGSTKDTAKRFKRWVTSEVLPSIRKTGSYSTTRTMGILPSQTQDIVNAILLIGDAVAKVPGVKTGIAMAATLTCIRETTGLPVESMRKVLPSANEPICSLNATLLGKLLNRSVKSTNKLLASSGLQFRNNRDEWELTESGKSWAEAMPYSRNGHSGYQILWNPAVVEHLKEIT